MTFCITLILVLAVIKEDTRLAAGNLKQLHQVAIDYILITEISQANFSINFSIRKDWLVCSYVYILVNTACMHACCQIFGDSIYLKSDFSWEVACGAFCFP